MLTLKVNKRGEESPEEVRARGAVPAVFYGPKEASTAIAVDARALSHVWKEAGHTSVVTLEGAGEQIDTLIKDVQVHPVSGLIMHADFYALEKGKKVRISVPLRFEGDAPAEKLGHIVVKALHEIEIEVAPQELPHHLPVPLSALENVGDRILASEIALPPSAMLVTHGEEVVASVTEFVEEKPQAAVPQAAAEAAPAQPSASEKSEAARSA